VKLSNLKYELIRTPLEQPLMRLRHMLGYPERRRHPELKNIHMEGERIDALWRRLIRRDTNCFDAGCHYGSVLSRFCSLAPQGAHMAIEAMPSKAAFLRRKFPEVRVLQMALSDKPGTVSFYINLDQSGFSGLAPHSDGKFEKIEVPGDCLDNIVPSNRRFDVLKVDVEGAELSVFRGATEFLKRDRPTVLFECGPSGPPAFGYEAGEIHDLFASKDYLVFFIEDFLKGEQPIDRATFESALVFPFKAFNWVAVAAERVKDLGPFNRL
jgi:FkbM family methyltransferase